MDRALRSMCDVPVSVIFCTSCRFGWPGILSRYFSTPFVIRPRAPMITGTVCVLSCHSLVTSISRSLYFESFSNCFMDVFLSDGMATSISRHSFFFLFFIIMSGRLALMVRSVCMGKSHSMVVFSVSVTSSEWCSYHCVACCAP